MESIDVFVPAGGFDVAQKHYQAIYDATGIRNKALIPLAGKPMIHYVLDALDNAKHVKSITIGGLDEEELRFDFRKPVEYIAGGDTSFKTFMSALEHFKDKEYVASISSDIPLITSEMIDNIIDKVDTSSGIDAYLNVVFLRDLRRLYPEVTKVPFHLREGTMVGGDVNIFRPSPVISKESTLEGMFRHRKNPLYYAKAVSPWCILKYVVGRLSIDDLRSRIIKSFDFNLGAIITTFPEPCVDLDYAKDLPVFRKLCSRVKRKLEDYEDAFLMV